MQTKEDDYRHKKLRRDLVNSLREKGITDDRVLNALDTIPRHFFLDTAFERQAYEDRAFPIASGQTISQPYTVAFQTQLLQVQKFEKVLEVGTGSTYQSCVLAALGAVVLSVERQRELYDAASRFFFLKRYPAIKRFYGDGYAGLPSYAPFDKVLITAGAPFVPPMLLEQLKPGGIMVAPIGEESLQRMTRIKKGEDGSLKEEDFGTFSFVPMLEGKNNR
ncbi:MAG: protein-L-isoaspartate(D-aspartate) O-methyltransferase [Bacteroidetes bacterium]|nr:protein-L-isoaspartate(D-aspartate) O-methyltransferase [Bacteroidota bacterium]MBS1630265.1 protein-L-isoaspartate(D-aspartate) O-methyltransferase [Bacteroidota bacterium]